MPNTIQFKRGALSGLPSLSAGEPGFTTDQFRLYVGSAGGNRLVGVLHNNAATTAPTVNDDAGDGYSVGSRWIDTTNDKAYECVDSSVGSAVWQQQSGTGATGTVAVDYGGTGRTSHTAYAVLCGGTTSTGAQQSIASVGTSGQVLTSNGAGALPTFQTPSSSLDIAGLTAADPADADEVPIYDASATANRKVTVQEINALTGLSPGGRLTGSSTLPVTTADVTPSTLYYLPFVHNRVPLWDGTRWLAVTVADAGVSVALSGMFSIRPYDVFGYLSSGSLALEYLAWTSGTARATAVTIQDGRYCKDGDKTRLYLGTFYANDSTSTIDSVSNRWIWNMYNRRPRPMRVVKTSGTWTYATNTWRSANADATLRCQFVLGIAEDAVVADVRINTTGGSTAGTVGVGLDQTAGNDAQVLVEAGDPSGTGYVLNTHARYNGNPAAGYHYLQWVEKVRAGTMTFRADLTPSVGMEAEVWA